MRNEERVLMDVPMPIAGGGVNVPSKMPSAADHVERRRSTTPLIFEAVERRKMNIQKAGVDVLQETRRIQDEAATEGLRAQVRGFGAQLEAARAAGRAEALAELDGELRARVEGEREAMVRACAQFNAERARYFGEVEGEVVRLALAIAERVLHRESKMDPMLLTASVRLALEKVAGETGTVLRVPAATQDQWRALFGEGADRAAEVVGDEKLGAGECVMETTVGRVELGVAVQLEEIEKGFFDLLQKRPV
jgi:flagellar assembly protein FliH